MTAIGEAFRNRRIFLTGGTGFFGKSILSSLKKKQLPELSLTILARSPEKFLAENPEFSDCADVSYVAGDVRSFAFPREQFDAVIHAATPASSAIDAEEMTSVIVDGTKHVLDFARTCGARRFMLTSSGAVYGPQPPESAAIAEELPCRPITAYGKGKLIAEQMCLDSGIATLLPRCFAFCGPYLNREIHFAIGNFIRDCLNGQPIVIQGDGTALRSYLHADDLVEWLFTILADGKPGRVYNVGSDHAVSIRELAETVRRAVGSTNGIRIQTAPVAGMAPSRYVPDITRAQTELGLRVKIPLMQTIQQSISR